MDKAMQAWSDDLRHEVWQGGDMIENCYWYWAQHGVGRQW